MSDPQCDYPLVDEWKEAVEQRRKEEREITDRLERHRLRGREINGLRVAALCTKFRYSFDLDGTLCDTEGKDYANAKPRPEMIALVNALVDAGHQGEIVTGRGYLDGVPSEIKVAAYQLASWGCRCTKIGSRSPSNIVFDDKGWRVTRQRYAGYDWS